MRAIREVAIAIAIPLADNIAEIFVITIVVAAAIAAVDYLGRPLFSRFLHRDFRRGRRAFRS